MKKILGATFALGLSLGVPFTVQAEDLNEVFTAYVDATNSEGEVVRAFIVSDGKLTPISSEQYDQYAEEGKKQLAEINASTPSIPPIVSNDPLRGEREITPAATIVSSNLSYREQNYNPAVSRPDLNRRISVPVYNGSKTNSAVRTYAYSASQSYTTSIELTTPEIKLIKGGITAGVDWNKTYSATESIEQTVSPLHYGWMDYYPIMSYSYGAILKTTYAIPDIGVPKLIEEKVLKNVKIFSARKLEGASQLPDGVYALRESKYRPN